MAIDTKSVARRRLRFTSLPEVIVEAERLAAADKASTLKKLGNWSTGQVFNHVASWASYPYEGFPERLTAPPWFFKPLLKLLRSKYLKSGFPQGVRIPKVEGGTVGTEPLSTEDGLKKLRAAMTRLETTPPVHASPAFGSMSHDELKQLNMRHAELHFGFLQPQ